MSELIMTVPAHVVGRVGGVAAGVRQSWRLRGLASVSNCLPEAPDVPHRRYFVLAALENRLLKVCSDVDIPLDAVARAVTNRLLKAAGGGREDFDSYGELVQEAIANGLLEFEENGGHEHAVWLCTKPGPNEQFYLLDGTKLPPVLSPCFLIPAGRIFADGWKILRQYMALAE